MRTSSSAGRAPPTWAIGQPGQPGQPGCRKALRRAPTVAVRARRKHGDGDGDDVPDGGREIDEKRKDRRRGRKPAGSQPKRDVDHTRASADADDQLSELPAELPQLIHMRLENERKRVGAFRATLDAAWAESEESTRVVFAAQVVGAILRKWDNRPFEIALVARCGMMNLDVLPTVNADMPPYFERVDAIVQRLNAWDLGHTVLRCIAGVPDGVEPYTFGGYIDGPIFNADIDMPISFDLGVTVAQFLAED